jgi:AcrR family transcriptional regulator
MSRPVKPVPATPARARGRPRSARARTAILRAARELMDRAGPGAVTTEAVAARAGVGKPTVYRWWPDRHAVAMAALMEGAREVERPARARAPLPALRQQLRDTAATFASRTGRSVAAMIATSDPDTELSKAFRNQFVLARREEGRALLREGIARGDVRRDVDLEATLDLIYGALFFRVLVGHAQPDAAFAEEVLDAVLRGVAPARPARRSRQRVDDDGDA